MIQTDDSDMLRTLYYISMDVSTTCVYAVLFHIESFIIVRCVSLLCSDLRNNYRSALVLTRKFNFPYELLHGLEVYEYMINPYIIYIFSLVYLIYSMIY